MNATYTKAAKHGKMYQVHGPYSRIGMGQDPGRVLVQIL